MNILLTGGTGYIGSHAAVVLAQAGHTVVTGHSAYPGVQHRVRHPKVPAV